MFGIGKLYSMGIIVVVAIAAIGGIWLHGRSVGYDACKLEMQQAVDQEKDRQGTAVEELKEIEVAKTAKINERIIYVKSKIKPGECLATDAPADILTDLK